METVEFVEHVVARNVDYRPPCRSCAGQNGVHYLTCKTLKLPELWPLMVPDVRYGPHVPRG